MENKKTRIVLYISQEQARELKSNLALKGETVSRWMRKQITQFLLTPNSSL